MLQSLVGPCEEENMFSQLVFSKRELSFEQQRDTEHDIIPHPFIICVSGVFNVNTFLLLGDTSYVRVQRQPLWSVSSNHDWVCVLNGWSFCVACFWNKYQGNIVLPAPATFSKYCLFFTYQLYLSASLLLLTPYIDVLMLQGYREKKASRALAGSKGLLGLMAVREKRGMLDQRAPEVPFLLFFLFFILTLLFNARLEISSDEVVRLLTATP